VGVASLDRFVVDVGGLRWRDAVVGNAELAEDGLDTPGSQQEQQGAVPVRIAKLCTTPRGAQA